jgi:hypothetical protein
MTLFPESPVDFFSYIHVVYYSQPEEKPVITYPDYNKDIYQSPYSEAEIFV